MKSNDSAYPVHCHGTHGELQGGLTKREYFAAMAMQGVLAGDGAFCNNSETSLDKPDVTAERAVQLADALIAELSKSSKIQDDRASY